jgi:hypothetical protein
MLCRVKLAHTISHIFIEIIAANIIVAGVGQLDHLVATDKAERQVKRTAAPIKYEDTTALKFGQFASIIWLRTQPTIKRRQGFMYKLFDGNACLPGCFAKAATAVTIKVNRNGHDCTPKLLGCRPSLRTLGIFA